MSELKVATLNAEWMVSIFGGLWSAWESPNIPSTFPGRKIGPIELEPIDDVPALCERIAGVIRSVGAQIIGIQEAPPLKRQMDVFVHRFLNDDYAVYYSNSRWQSICALVHRSVNEHVSAFAHNGPETHALREKSPFYPWGGITEEEQKQHRFYRTPLILTFSPGTDKEVRIVVVHAKSKYSLLKSREQWESRDRGAILDALLARQKLSTETACLRRYLESHLGLSDKNSAIVVLGDFNDGPFAELMEREFLIHNIIDELAGTLLLPRSNLRHAMAPDVLATAATTRFPDPLEGGKIVEELIDHILVSPSIWAGSGPFALKENSCQVEAQAYEDHFDDHGPERKRGLRPSDHKPVSAVLAY
jgi:endonuclease/exonuclease/phosphatase family metal-dependent hydrolase